MSIFARANESKPYNGAVNHFENEERTSSRALTELGVANAIGLNTSFGYVTDERATYKIPSIYWVQTQKEELVKLNDTEVTTIPVALNNILENVSEHGWDRFVSVSEEEYQEWKKSKGNFAFQYVVTDFKGERHFKSIDPALYMKAEILYNEAKKDVAAIDSLILNKATGISDPDDYHLVVEREGTKVSQALAQNFRANVELSMLLKLQNLTSSTGASQHNRSPASIGEHTAAPMNIKSSTINVIIRERKNASGQ